MNQIVSTNWVYKNINDKKIIIFDCSWRMPGEKTYDFKEFSKYHLKKSIFFNIDEISNIKSKLPHTIPSPIFFEKKMRNFGVNRNSIIILYDIFGIFSAPRVWWMFKYFGHEKVYLMNGGLKKWLKEKKPTTNKLFKIKKGNFKSKINKD